MKAIHIYLSHFQNESRILKQTKSLVEHRVVDNIIVIALWKQGLKEFENIDERRRVWRIKRLTQRLPKSRIFSPLKYLEILFRSFLFIRKNRPKFVNIHEVALLPLVFLLKLFVVNTKIIYDAHELETETNGSKGLKRILLKFLERRAIKLVDYTFVVSPAIETWYRSTYKIRNIATILNCPAAIEVMSENKFREKLNISGESLIFLYQGGLSFGRGIKNILDAFTVINDPKYTVVFMGYGEYEAIIKEYSMKYNNIHFLPAVPPNEVLHYTASADVGLSLIENTCLSYYYCLPNKLYEYIMAGIPSLVSDMPEMTRVIEGHDIGVVAKSYSADEIVRAVKQFSIDSRGRFISNLRRIKHLYNWRNEEEKMVNIYKSRLN